MTMTKTTMIRMHRHSTTRSSLQVSTAIILTCWSLLLVSSCGVQAAALRFIPKSELPQNDWISMNMNHPNEQHGWQFLPADNNNNNNNNILDQAHRQLYNAYSNTYNSQPFADSTADYSSYQQAWRMLGFMIDCSVTNDGSSGGSGDRNKNKNGNGNAATNEGCQRYVVWAAYVDLEYQGGGIGEYQYWDREKGQWDQTACKYASNNNKNNNNNNNNNENGGSRCAKMDCHLTDTHFTLLGFFKHPNYSDWFGQLFKHEGMCIWSSDEYSFMKNARKAWPSGCTTTSTTRSDGSPIYYDLKPLENGRITVGLYTDTRCVEEYKSTGYNDPITVENVVGNVLLSNQNSRDNKNGNNNNNNNDASEYTLSEAQSIWDNAFDAWTVCQPCVAYDLNNVGYNANDDASKGSAYGTYTYGYDDYYYKYYYGNKGADFDCYDDAGYTNVNQCMKFMAKTTMYTATYRDLALATTQGTLVDNPVVASYTKVSKSAVANLSTTKAQRAAKAFVTSCFFVVSVMFLMYGTVKFWRARKEMRNDSGASFSMKESLVMA